MTDALKLLPKSALVRTSQVDHPDWNYRPLLRGVQRLRFRIALDLLAGGRYRRLLEIGYGSGVFMPSLVEHCAELHGVDPHPLCHEVEESLARHHVPATLSQASVESLPYPDGHFDGVVTISALEYVPDIDAACREIHPRRHPGVGPGATPGDRREPEPVRRPPAEAATHPPRPLPARPRGPGAPLQSQARASLHGATPAIWTIMTPAAGLACGRDVDLPVR
jgi:SAM-dependent methyltransferase